MLSTAVTLAGGLAIFLLGMLLFSRAMEKFAGAGLQRAVERLTRGKLRSFLTGFGAAAVMQSSGLVMVTLISLMRTSFISLPQTVAVILGFEVGSTITAQLISFEIGIASLALIALGFFAHMLSRRLTARYLGQAVLGMGLLFLGMSLMKEAMLPLESSAAALELFALLGGVPVLGVLLGALASALIHSSAAVVGLLIAMGAVNAITLPGAIAVAMGANIGTCITGYLASLGNGRAAKQAVLAQVLIATLAAAAFLPFISPFSSLVSLTATTLSRQIANAHTLHNLISSLLLLPFAGLIAAAVHLLMPSSPALMEKPLPDVASLQQVRQEVVELGRKAGRMLELGGEMLLSQEMVKRVPELLEMEEEVDRLRYAIERKLTSEAGAARERIVLLHHAVDIERVADHAVNLSEHARELKDGLKEDEERVLRQMLQLVQRSYHTALDGMEKRSAALMREVRALEQSIDRLNRRSHDTYLRALDQGINLGRSAAVFLDAMRDLERIGDHANNIAKELVTYEDGEVHL